MTLKERALSQAMQAAIRELEGGGDVAARRHRAAAILRAALLAVQEPKPSDCKTNRETGQFPSYDTERMDRRYSAGWWK